MKWVTLFLLVGMLLIPKLFGQINQVESTVISRSGAYITIKPASYDLDVLPKIGDKVVFSVYLKTNLPDNKPEGFYELFIGVVTKLIPAKRAIVIKGQQEISIAEVKHGIDNVSVSPRQKVKICWTSKN